MKRTFALWLLIAIVVIGVGIRSYHLTSRSLWFDEAFSWRLVQFPVSEMISRDAADVHPPLYYLLLKGWTTVFGSSLLALRSFSVTLAGITILAAYQFAAYAAGRRSAGLLAAAIVAFAGFQIAFAWEARMYTLATAIGLFSSWLLLKSVRSKPQSIMLWVAYAAAAAALAYTHYYAFFTLAAHAVFVLGYIIVQTRWRIGELLQLKTFWYAVASAVLAIILYSPWIPAFIAQNSQVQQAYWVPPIGGWSIPDTFYRFLAPTSGIPPHEGVIGPLITVIPITGTIALWLLLSFSSFRRLPADSRFLVMLSGLVPFALSIAISLLAKQSLYQDRFLFLANLFILIGLALAVSAIPWRWPRRTVAALCVAGLAAASLAYWQELKIPQKPGAHAAAAQIFTSGNLQEPVIVTSPFVYFAILHYAAEEFDRPQSVKLYSEDGKLSHFAGGPILMAEDVIGPQVFSDVRESLWVVDTTGFGGSIMPLPQDWTVAERSEHPEVFPHQGTVIVTRYTRH